MVIKKTLRSLDITALFLLKKEADRHVEFKGTYWSEVYHHVSIELENRIKELFPPHELEVLRTERLRKSQL